MAILTFSFRCVRSLDIPPTSTPAASLPSLTRALSLSLVHRYNISAWSDKEWVPSSCCDAASNATLDLAGDSAADNSTCGRDAERDSPRYRTHGCYNKIRHWILEHLHIVGLTCIIFAFIQFFAIVSAMLVVCTMDFKNRRPRVSSRPSYNRVRRGNARPRTQ